MLAELCKGYDVLEEGQSLDARLVPSQEERVFGAFHEAWLCFAETTNGADGLGFGGGRFVGLHDNISTVPEN